MKAKLIAYDLSKLDHYKKVLVNRALYGYNDHSNKGNYFYKREGVLNGVPHLRLLRGVILVKPNDQKKVVDILKKYKTKHSIFTVEVKSSLLR